jgi:hypothetical protein
MAIFRIQNIHIENASLQANEYVAGMISPGAFLGLAGAMQKRLSGGSPYKVAVLPVFHDIEHQAGRTIGELVVDSARQKTCKVVEIKQDMRGRVRMSLIVEMRDGDATEIQVKRFVERARIAGGFVAPDPIHPERDITVHRCDSWADIKMSDLPRGYAVMPLKGPVTDGNKQGWLNLLRARADSMQKGRVVNVSAAGYRTLNVRLPAMQGLRDGVTPHDFGEPLTSLSQSISTRNLFFRGLSAADLEGLAWAWSVKPGSNLRLYSPAYH